MVVLGLPLNWVIEKIPGLRDIKADTEGIERRLGPTFGDPMVMGLIIGVVLGVIAYFGDFGKDFLGTLAKILVLGIQLAAVMVLLPRMVRILMEGLIPVSEAARSFMAKRAAGREIHIGLDSAVLVGHPANISSGLLLVPIAILLSVILPGNRMLLFADLAVLVFLCTQFAPAAKGNVVRMVIIGTVVLIVGFYVSNALAPTITKVALEAGFKVPENAQSAAYISSIADGFVWTPLAFLALGKYLGWIGMRSSPLSQPQGSGCSSGTKRPGKCSRAQPRAKKAGRGEGREAEVGRQAVEPQSKCGHRNQVSCRNLVPVTRKVKL